MQTSHGVQWASERESSVGNSIDEIDYEVLASVLKELGMLSRIVFRSAWWRGVSFSDIRFVNFMKSDVHYTATSFSFIGGCGGVE